MIIDRFRQVSILYYLYRGLQTCSIRCTIKLKNIVADKA